MGLCKGIVLLVLVPWLLWYALVRLIWWLLHCTFTGVLACCTSWCSSVCCVTTRACVRRVCEFTLTALLAVFRAASCVLQAVWARVLQPIGRCIAAVGSCVLEYVLRPLGRC